MRLCFKLGLIFILPLAIASADLIENQFEAYIEGELLDQQGWAVQGIETEGEGYVNLPDRAEVRIDPEKQARILV